MAVIKPRREISSWSNESGSIYSNIGFDYGYIVGVTYDGAAMTDGGDATPSSGEFWWDSSNSKLYINTGSDPSGETIIVTYEIHVASSAVIYNRDPDDNTTDQIHFNPYIINAPDIIKATQNIIFGVFPTYSSFMALSNTEQFWWRHVYDSSFNKAEIKVWHYLDRPEYNDLVFSGEVGGKLDVDDQQLRITVFDDNKIFDREFRHPLATHHFFSTSVFGTALDQQYINRPIPSVYGVKDGCLAINVDFDSENPSTSNNRNYIVVNRMHSGGSYWDDYDVTVTGVDGTISAVNDNFSLTSGSTGKLESAVQKFNIGDHVKMTWDGASTPGIGPTVTGYGLITGINKESGSEQIDGIFFGNVTDGGDAAVVNDVTIQRLFVGSVTLLQNNNSYALAPIRDFTAYRDSTTGAQGFTLTSSAESNVGANTVTPYDILICRVYGPNGTVQLNSSAFGNEDAYTGNESQAAVLAYAFLKDHLGVAETDIDIDSFSDAQDATVAADDPIGISIPANPLSDAFPKYRELYEQMLFCILGRLFKNVDNKWELSQANVLGSSAATISDDDLAGAPRFTIDYDEIYNLINVVFNRGEIDQILPANSYSSTVTATANLAEYLHDSRRQKTFESLHFFQSDAQRLCDRLSYIFSDRRLMAEFNTTTEFLQRDPGDTITMSSERLPGFTFVSGTENTDTFSVNEIRKRRDQTFMVVDDQKSIEDNSATYDDLDDRVSPYSTGGANPINNLR